MTKDERKLVANYIISVPIKPYKVIAAECGLKTTTVQRIATEFDIHRPSGKKITFHIPEAKGAGDVV